MSHAISGQTVHIDPDPTTDVAIVNVARPDLAGTTGAQHQPAAPLCPLATGSLMASNPPGPRPSHFKVLGNEQLGFQVWLSRDGLTWLPFGQGYPTSLELAAAFAASQPRPAVVLDPVVASAYNTLEQ